MPAFQSLVLTDRQTTPVNHTLLPKGKDQSGSVYVVALPDSSGASITETRFSLGKRRTSDRSRSTLKLRKPRIVTETINGVAAPKVDLENYVDVTFNFSTRATEQERKDIVGMLESALAVAKTLVNDFVVKDQDIW